MGSTRELNVTLSNEAVDEVRARVASGQYANESEMISEGLRALQDRDQALDTWLRDTAIPAYEAYLADPSRGIPLEDVQADLAARHRRATQRD